LSHGNAPLAGVAAEAKAVLQALRARRARIVLAESCTAGLVAASLGRMAGVSRVLCGSAVAYREDTKQQWLDVPRGDLDRYTAVSEPVAGQMAVGVLEKTPEAQLAVSVTGHFGPKAPPELDGVIFVGVAQRQVVSGQAQQLGVWRYQLQAVTRVRRQQEAAARVLRCLRETVEGIETKDEKQWPT
jgi:PncC family amidohydrolase